MQWCTWKISGWVEIKEREKKLMKEKGDRNWYVYGKQWLNVHQGINIEMISMEEITQKKNRPNMSYCMVPINCNI